MAEFVQQSLEQMLPELEQLQRVQIFSQEEVKLIMKKRKHFEYKIQKQTKRKEDFLSYIQYESSLLSLISLRRDNLGYSHKKDDIDYPVARRINKLFKILEHRFASDLKIWTSHIDFLKRMSWQSSVSKVYRSLLRHHPNDTRLWIAAAKHEMEEAGSPADARTFMLEALRLHPDDRDLFREYFRLELMYVDQLLRRSAVLGVEEKLRELPDETRDAVLDCGVALAVFRRAAAAVAEPQFVAELLGVARQFGFAANVRAAVVDHLRAHHAAHAVTVDVLARQALHEKCDAEAAAGDDVAAAATPSSKGGRFASCCRIYKRGLEENASAELLDYYLTTLLSLSSLLPPPPASSSSGLRVAAALLDAFQWASERQLLNETQFKQWYDLLSSGVGASAASERVLALALQQHPTAVYFLREHFGKRVSQEEPDLPAVRQDLLSRLARASADVAGSAQAAAGRRQLSDLAHFVFCGVFGRCESEALLLLSSCAVALPWACGPLRAAHVALAHERRGIDAARKAYDAHAYSPPFDARLHRKMLELEAGEPKPDRRRLRRAFEIASDQFGRTDVDIWLAFLRFEEDRGNAAECALIQKRAERALENEQLKQTLRAKY